MVRRDVTSLHVWIEGKLRTRQSVFSEQCKILPVISWICGWCIRCCVQYRMGGTPHRHPQRLVDIGNEGKYTYSMFSFFKYFFVTGYYRRTCMASYEAIRGSEQRNVHFTPDHRLLDLSPCSFVDSLPVFRKKNSCLRRQGRRVRSCSETSLPVYCPCFYTRSVSAECAVDFVDSSSLDKDCSVCMIYNRALFTVICVHASHSAAATTASLFLSSLLLKHNPAARYKYSQYRTTHLSHLTIKWIGCTVLWELRRSSLYFVVCGTNLQ
jgi:hypothetical protein